MYSLEENGMELRGCMPELPPEELTAESLLLPDEPDDAVSFGFLEGVFEPWLGAEPIIISKSVL